MQDLDHEPWDRAPFKGNYQVRVAFSGAIAVPLKGAFRDSVRDSRFRVEYRDPYIIIGLRGGGGGGVYCILHCRYTQETQEIVLRVLRGFYVIGVLLLL